MNVGSLRIDPVIDGVARLPPTEAFAWGGPNKGTNEADWEPHRALLAADGMLEMQLGGFLIRGGPLGERIALVDCGVALNRPPFVGGELLGALDRLGVAPGDITDLIFTHLHYDHVGWASRDGEVVFTHATYRCDERDWAYFMERETTDRAELRSARLLEPARERFEMFTGDGPLLPGIDRIGAAGHTPGSAMIVLSDADQRAMLLGDVVHCPVELIDDEWGGIGDVDPALAARTRMSLARELEGNDIPAARALPRSAVRPAPRRQRRTPVGHRLTAAGHCSTPGPGQAAGSRTRGDLGRAPLNIPGRAPGSTEPWDTIIKVLVPYLMAPG